MSLLNDNFKLSHPLCQGTQVSDFSCQGMSQMVTHNDTGLEKTERSGNQELAPGNELSVAVRSRKSRQPHASCGRAGRSAVGPAGRPSRPRP